MWAATRAVAVAWPIDENLSFVAASAKHAPARCAGTFGSSTSLGALPLTCYGWTEDLTHEKQEVPAPFNTSQQPTVVAARQAHCGPAARVRDASTYAHELGTCGCYFLRVPRQNLVLAVTKPSNGGSCSFDGCVLSKWPSALGSATRASKNDASTASETRRTTLRVRTRISKPRHTLV